MKLAVDQRLSDDPQRMLQRLTDLLTQHARQVNGISEGSIAAIHNARTAAPTTGTWAQGDFVRNSAPVDSGGVTVLGWLCVASGTPGTWFALSIGATGGSLSDGDYGDISVSGGGTAMTVDNDVVSYAKMQNVSAASKLLGRGDSGSGDPQEITLGTGLSMAGTTLNVTATGSSSLDDSMAFTWFMS